MPLCRRARKDHRPSGLLAQRCVYSQRHTHVHRVAERVADDGVRPMHAPSEAVALSRRKDLVFLRIVKVLDIQAALLFSKGRLRQLTLAVALERPQVMLQSGDQRDVLHGLPGRNCLQQVAHHARIDADVFSLCRLPQPGREEDVCRRCALQCRAQGRTVLQIRGDGCHASQRQRPACKPIHIPLAACDQLRSNVLPHNARCSNHQRRSLAHAISSPVR